MPTPSTTSPNVGNLQVGKGIVSFKREGAADYRDIGNVSALTVTPDMTTLEHFSSREGVKKKDLTIIIEKKSTVVFTMEEFTPENLAIGLLGAVDLAAVGGPEVELFSENAINGKLRFVGTNDVGPKITLDLFNVSILPNGDTNFISDEWNNMEITGDVLVAPEDDAVAEHRGKFGIAKFTNVVAPS